MVLGAAALGLLLTWHHWRASSSPVPAVTPVASFAPPPSRPPVARPALADLNPAACQPSPPTGDDKHTTVFVDAGHGGVDPGAIGRTSAGSLIQEKDVTLAVAQLLEQELRSAGYTVLMSRTSDQAVAQLGPGDTDENGFTQAGEHKDTADRVRCANAGHAKLLVAIHLNSFEDPSAGGAETLYDSSRDFAGQNKRLADLVQSHLMDSFTAHGWSVPDRGVKDDSDVEMPAYSVGAQNYGHLLELGPAQAGWLDEPSQMPGVLTEPLFITDRAEADVAGSPAGRQAIADGVAQAIVAFLAGS